MRWLPRRLLEPLLVVVVTLGLAAAFWFAWRQGGQPSAVAPAHRAPASSSAARPSAPASPSPTGDLQPHGAGVGKLQEKAQQHSHQLATPPVARFTFGQFNVLGAVHTARGGEEAKRPSGTARTPLMYHLLLSHHVDVGALQEFERVQQRVFRRIAGRTYAVWPGLRGKATDAENSVIWRRDRFNLVKAETRPYPYFDGNIRNMPRVLLEDRQTGVRFWVTSYHNAANTRRHHHQTGYRQRAMHLEVADARALLRRQKLPLIVSGDMNERELYFCTMATGAPMHAANGGSVQGGCHPPHPIWIDWIWGSKAAAFSDYVQERSRATKRASDHPILTTRVAVTGQPGDRPSD